MFPFDSISSSVAGAVGKASQAGLKQAKRGKVVARVNTKRSKERRQERQAPAGILSAKDMIQLFQSMPVPNRGYRNPNADQPGKMGQGMKWWDENNSPEQVAARQNRVNTEQTQIRNNAQEAARSAVVEAKARQGMPVAAPSSKYGTGSVSFFQPGEVRPMATTIDPITGKKVPLRSFLDDAMDRQELKYGPGVNQVPAAAPRAPQAPKPQAQDAMATANADFDSLFANAPMAQPKQVTARLPTFANPGMQFPPMAANDGPQRTPMMPNDGPFRPEDVGPQLPYSGGEQLMALERLYGFGGNTNPTLTALEGTWSNIFPGNDYDYLRQLFPGLVHPQAGSGQVMSSLAKMYQNPAYQSQFDRLNQSEFYK
jgi:hypothetical protein